VQNVTQGQRYDFIFHAVEDANDGDEIVAAQGVYQGNVDFAGKAVTIRSEDPNDPAIVAATVIEGGAKAVAFTTYEDANSMLAGLTLTGATHGVYCQGSSPTIRNCRIVNNTEAGVKLWETDTANPTFANCIIAGNAGAGIEMVSARGGRFRKYNCATVLHCTIVGNVNEAVCGGDPIIVNSILYANGGGGSISQIDAHAATVSGCSIEGGCPGTGNIDAAPGFVTPGFWAFADEPNQPTADMPATWVQGDYHLRQDSPCVDTGVAEPIFDWLTTDIDGDPRCAGDRPDIGCDEFAPAAEAQTPAQSGQ
jgi:hypothetical protein